MAENETTAMGAKDYDLATMLKTNSRTLQLAAAKAYGEKKWLSGIAMILNTKGIPETKELQYEGIRDLINDDKIFTQFIERNNASGEARAVALQWKNVIALLLEIVKELGEATGQIELDKNGNPRGKLPDFNDGHEPEADLAQDHDPNVRASVAVRGPFIHFPPFRDCHENNFPLAVECGGCGIVVKEFRGLQLRLVLRRLTKVVEPWTSRARIIFRWVWILEWVPVEVIKTITVRCGCDKRGVSVNKRVILDRGLINFWRCL